MEYIIEHLAAMGSKDIMVNVAFNHWKIENYFGDGHRWGVNIGYAFEGAREHGEIVPKALGLGGRHAPHSRLQWLFDETTIVLCGDAIIDLDIKAALFEHKTKGAIASVVTLPVPRDQVQNYGIVVADKNGKSHLLPGKTFARGGALELCQHRHHIFEPEVLDLVPPGKGV